MVGTVPSRTTVPLPRRPLDPDDRQRHWYENELGWRTVPGEPLRLVTGLRFDVLDVPVEAGAAALWRLGPDSPVAVRDDRMWLLVAAGSAEELPGCWTGWSGALWHRRWIWWRWARTGAWRRRRGPGNGP